MHYFDSKTGLQERDWTPDRKKQFLTEADKKERFEKGEKENHILKRMLDWKIAQMCDYCKKARERELALMTNVRDLRKKVRQLTTQVW